MAPWTKGFQAGRGGIEFCQKEKGGDAQPGVKYHERRRLRNTCVQVRVKNRRGKKKVSLKEKTAGGGGSAQEGVRNDELNLVRPSRERGTETKRPPIYYKGQGKRKGKR